jgi:hypothetical protein
LPLVDQVQPVAEGGLVKNPSNFRLEFGNVFPHDISNKLRLELSPSVLDMNLISGSTQGSNKEEESQQKNMSKGELTGMQTRTRLAFTPKTLDHADNGASLILTWIHVYHKKQQLLSSEIFIL